MSVVGTHGDGYTTLLLQFQEGFHDFVHVDVAFQVVGFVEVAFGITLGAAQVNEMDAVCKLLHKGSTVVGTAHAQGSGAEAQAVAGIGHGVNQGLEIGCAAHDAGQTQDGAGRVIGMDDELDAGFIGHGGYFLQEVDEVGAQLFGGDALVTVQFVLELFQGEAFF